MFIAHAAVAVQQGDILRRWFEDRVLPAFAERVLAFDLPAARILATYRVPEYAPPNDALIAAIAQVADMNNATRNTRHFEPLGSGRLPQPVASGRIATSSPLGRVGRLLV